MNNETINKLEVGKRIKAIRINKKLTMKDFGKNLNPVASDSIVSRWERGISLPNNQRVKQIADLGNVSVTYLLYGEKTYADIEILDKDKMTDIEEFFYAGTVQRKDEFRNTISKLEEQKIVLEETDYTALTELYEIIIELQKNKLHKSTMIFLTNLISDLKTKISDNDVSIEEYTKNQLKIIEMIKNM